MDFLQEVEEVPPIQGPVLIEDLSSAHVNRPEKHCPLVGTRRTVERLVAYALIANVLGFNLNVMVRI